MFADEDRTCDYCGKEAVVREENTLYCSFHWKAKCDGRINKHNPGLESDLVRTIRCNLCTARSGTAETLEAIVMRVKDLEACLKLYEIGSKPTIQTTGAVSMLKERSRL